MKGLLSEIQRFQKKVCELPAGKAAFNELALVLFRFQAEHNALYNQFLKLINCEPAGIHDPEEIPCLPIHFFRDHVVQTGQWKAVTYFESSGTTGSVPSRHYVPETDFYHAHARQLFQENYGDLSEWIVLALLPSYLERAHASLVSMAGDFIRESGHPVSGFYLDNRKQLREAVSKAGKEGRKVLLLGVSFALLDLAEEGPLPIERERLVVMETGGMKGRRKEMIRQELHACLCAGLGVQEVHSEYGMTELFSQAYAVQNGIFKPSRSLHVYIRDINDPFSLAPAGRSGGVNIIDLANVHSCCFLETQDLGRVNVDGTFEILGRFDQADVRGCNLMVL